MQFSPTPPKTYLGSTSNEVAVRFLGKDAKGSVNLQLNVTTPETPDDDPQASVAQLRAVRELFSHIPADISAGQAHALLCYRDYAAAVINRVLPDYSADQRQTWIAIIATLVSHDERIAKDVRRWSDDRFRQARSEARTVSTKHFSDLMIICRELAGAIDSQSR